MNRIYRASRKERSDKGKRRVIQRDGVDVEVVGHVFCLLAEDEELRALDARDGEAAGGDDAAEPVAAAQASRQRG